MEEMTASSPSAALFENMAHTYSSMGDFPKVLSRLLFLFAHRNHAARAVCSPAVNALISLHTGQGVLREMSGCWNI
jgi:hypothetical protein